MAQAINYMNRIIKLFFNYDWEIVEIQGAVFKICWGIWLLLPFRVFRMVQGYNAIGNENYWGWGLLILGLIHFAAIASNKLSLRRWITFIAILFWIFSIILIWLQSHTAGLLPMFAVIGFFMTINFWRLGIMMKVEKRRKNIGPPAGMTERRSV